MITNEILSSIPDCRENTSTPRAPVEQELGSGIETISKERSSNSIAAVSHENYRFMFALVPWCFSTDPWNSNDKFI
jgi:hypothetical protein